MVLARRSLSPVRSFAATVVEPRPTGKVFAWQEELFSKKSCDPKNDDETVVLAVLHDKHEGTFDPLT